MPAAVQSSSPPARGGARALDAAAAASSAPVAASAPPAPSGAAAATPWPAPAAPAGRRAQGSVSASSSAIRPPMLLPATCARSISSASSTSVSTPREVAGVERRAQRLDRVAEARQVDRDHAVRAAHERQRGQERGLRAAEPVHGQQRPGRCRPAPWRSGRASSRPSPAAAARTRVARRGGEEAGGDVQVVAHPDPVARARRARRAPLAARCQADGGPVMTASGSPLGGDDPHAGGVHERVVGLVAGHEAHPRLERRIHGRRVVAVGQRLHGFADHVFVFARFRARCLCRASQSEVAFSPSYGDLHR